MGHRGVLFKLIMLGGISNCAIIGMGIYGLSRTNSTYHRVEDVYRTAEDVRRVSEKIATPLSEVRQLTLSTVIAPNAKFRANFAEQQELLSAQLDETLKQWKLEISDDAEREAFENFCDEWEHYKRLKELTIAKAFERYREEAFINSDGAAKEQFHRVRNQLNVWIQVKIDNANQVYQEASAQFSRMQRVSLIVIAVLVLVVGGIGFITARSIVRPLAVLTDAASRISNHELVKEIPVHSQDELGTLAHTMKMMVAAIQTHQARQLQTEAEVRALNARLEQRVKERTEELERTNRALEAEIGERQRMETLLRESDERLNLALKSSGVGTWSWNVVENSIIWDDFIHPLFGLKPGTFPGRYEDFLQMLIPEDRERVAQEVKRSVEDDAVYDTEYQVVWPNGAVRVLGSRGKVYRDQAGRALRMTGVCWDTTERKRLEERFRAVVESTPVAKVMINAAGAIVLVNQKSENLFGYERSELLGKPVEVLLPERFRAGHQQLRNGFFAAPQARSKGAGRDLYGLRKDGTEFPVEIGLGPIQTEEGLFVLAAVVDITERKRAEEMLVRQAQELTRSNKELEQFAYIASHDLQEPLRKVQSFGDLLAAKTGEALGEEGRDYLKRMQNAAKRMQGLINDLLSLSRVASQAKAFVPVDLAQVAREVVSDLEVRIQSTAGRVDIGALPRVIGDPLQLRQLLQNLIGNALKFHRPDVPPVVSVQGRVVKQGDGPGWQHSTSDLLCELTVQDNGIGFEEKYLDRIFAPFERLHGREEFEGTGMGLAICRKIAERHGGAITARSIPGQGTTFIVTLPQEKPRDPTHA